ncbi:MAG: TerC family protein, partial [Phycisphaerae bacterium]
MAELLSAPLFTPENLLAFLTLAILEIVLGIDNIVFIAIISGKLDPSVQDKARRAGLAAAMIMRILMLLGISWILSLS